MINLDSKIFERIMTVLVIRFEYKVRTYSMNSSLKLIRSSIAIKKSQHRVLQGLLDVKRYRFDIRLFFCQRAIFPSDSINRGTLEWTGSWRVNPDIRFGITQKGTELKGRRAQKELAQRDEVKKKRTRVQEEPFPNVRNQPLRRATRRASQALHAETWRESRTQHL
ncbi:hypothetical protein NDU88_002809 [Pleurodeles waltl]|uniref:Uncharacterized protein n=1 Tax=Pleurodeles waltl TaxID=8319 RepID=A0AAV7TM57_PLEWA|nr:hypothetical protein NDU88_002809 [Pleurodeles waltl]